MLIPGMLRSERLRLTTLTEDDLPVLTRWHDDADFLRLLDARPAYPQTAAHLGEWIRETQNAKNGYLFGARLLEDNTLVGFIELDDILWAHGAAWIGIAIGERRGQGYGRESLSLVLDFAFRELNLHRVQATVFSYNAASNALFQSLGFQREGAFREFLHRDGQRYDMYLYGLLRPEWRQ